MSMPPFPLIAATHTPFHSDGSLNLGAVERQAEMLLSNGAAGAFVAGSTGECASLSVDERSALARRWVEVAGTSLQVIVHVGQNCQAEARVLAAEAAQLGVAGVAAVGPCYFKPQSVDHLLNFLEPIAKAAADVPFYYYDIPSMTGIQLPTHELLERGRERLPNLRGVKFSHTDLMQLQQCINVNDGEFDVLFGCDQALLSAVVLGVRGAVGSCYNFSAGLFRQILAAYADGEHEHARKLQYQAVRMVEVMVDEGFFGTSKWLMGELGVDCGPVRDPLGNLPADRCELLLQRLAELDVLDQPLASSRATSG